MLGFLVPTEKKFFPLFEASSANLVKMSVVLNKLVTSDSSEQQKLITKQLANLEIDGKKITHDTLNELSTNLITPFYREDVYSLTGVMDDIAKFIYVSGKRMDLYKLEVYTAEIIKLSGLIVDSVSQVNVAVGCLSHLKTKKTQIKEALLKINTIKNQAGNILELSITQMMETELDPIKIIKVKEIMQELEKATGKCGRVANVINGILIKYA